MNAPHSTRPRDDRGGFALAMVVFLLFAVALAGATGYQIVNAEHEMATGGEAGEEALSVARAGIERYVGEHVGYPVGTTFTVDSGTATVTVKKIATIDATTDMYMLQSVGTISDPRYPSSPATRTVRQFAKLHNAPVTPRAALMVAGGTSVTVSASSVIQGANDEVAQPVCDDLGDTDIYGIMARNTTGTTSGTLSGVPGSRYGGTAIAPWSVAAVLDTIHARWSVLENSNFPVGSMDGTSMPSFAGVASDSFPIVRINGNLTIGALTSVSGRGVLIVTGNFTQTSLLSFFTWDGIVLVGGGVATQTIGGGFGSGFTVNGMFVTGMDGGNPTNLTLSNANIKNCTYNIVKANRSIAYLELVDGSRWEF